MGNTDRFVWQEGDVEVISPGVDVTEDNELEFLLAKIDASKGDKEMTAEVVAEAYAYMARTQNVLNITAVRMALEKLTAGDLRKEQ